MRPPARGDGHKPVQMQSEAKSIFELEGEVGMTKQDELRACLNCKLPTCSGGNRCPVLQLAGSHKTVKVDLLVDLLRSGYDPVNILFAAIGEEVLE